MQWNERKRCSSHLIASLQTWKCIFQPQHVYADAHWLFQRGLFQNAVYRFLNSAKTNWLRFTTALASTIINDEVKELTDEKRSNVFILDDTLFNRTSCKRTELGSKVLTIPTCDTKKAFAF